MINIHRLLKEGVAINEAAAKEEEKKKLGTLRAGTSGILLADGKSVGACPRKAWIRSKGHTLEDHSFATQLMFQAGHSNEEQWMDLLRASYPHKILQEDEIPTKWTTSNGTAVTGRPDILLLDADNKPALVLELKLASSLWTVRDMLAGKPKADHLIQAAHYSWQLGVPAELWYTSRANFAVTSKDTWMTKQFPKIDEPGAEFCTYNDKDEIKSVNSVTRGYRLEWNARGQLLVTAIPFPSEDAHQQVFTNVTVDGIKKFYEEVSLIDTTQVLPKRPSNLHVDGSKMPYSACNYCPAKPACDNWEKKGFKEWEKAVEKIAVELESGKKTV